MLKNLQALIPLYPNVAHILLGTIGRFSITTFSLVILLILKGLNPQLNNLITDLYNIKDRGDRNDPADQRLGLAYFPKGLTTLIQTI